MANQLSLLGGLEPDISLDELRIVTWNVQNAARDRALRQADWLLSIAPHVAVLTELKGGSGREAMCRRLAEHGYELFGSDSDATLYTTVIAVSGLACEALNFKALEVLPERAVSICVQSPLGPITVVGLYVPSRGPIERRNVDKRRFQQSIMERLPSALKDWGFAHVIVCGDLNVVDHRPLPHYKIFGEWEYEFYDFFASIGLSDTYDALSPNGEDCSWFGRGGDGYRFDHMFASQLLVPQLVESAYIHDARLARLSDHSPLLTRLAVHR